MNKSQLEPQLAFNIAFFCIQFFNLIFTIAFLLSIHLIFISAFCSKKSILIIVSMLGISSLNPDELVAYSATFCNTPFFSMGLFDFIIILRPSTFTFFSYPFCLRFRKIVTPPNSCSWLL